MGDRSNINFITDSSADYDTDTETYAVLNTYLHWGGRNALIDALDVADGTAYNRRSDFSYFANPIIRKITEGTDDGLGAGVSARLAPSLEDAYKVQEDNEHLILTFDLVNQDVVVFLEGDDDGVEEHFDLDHDGIAAAREFILANDR